MNEKIVIANWKMKLSLSEAQQLSRDFKEKFKDFKKQEVVICPDFISLSNTKKICKSSNIKFGAQDVFWEHTGAYTGEISAELIKEVGCEYVIVGHSERRKYQQENYSMIHQKVKAVLEVEGLIPVVCIGEEIEDRKSDRRDFVLLEQLQMALGGIKLFKNQKIIVAYEPVWAIGTGTTIEPSEADYAHKIIGIALKDLFGSAQSKDSFRVIYGGSISGKNVNEFVNLENIDGFLVGGASLKAAEFYKIAKAILK